MDSEERTGMNGDAFSNEKQGQIPPVDAATQRVNQAHLFLQQGEFGRAQEELKALLAEEPQNSDAYFCLAMVHFGCKSENELIKKAGNLERSKDYNLAMQYASPERRKELANMNIMAKFEVNRRISYVRKKIDLLDMEERNISVEKIYITEKARVEETASKLKKERKELDFRPNKINDLLLSVFRKNKTVYWGILGCALLTGLVFCIKLTAVVADEGAAAGSGMDLLVDNLLPIIISFAVILFFGINQRYKRQKDEDDALAAKIFALEKEREDLHDNSYLDRLYTAYIETRKHRIAECEETIQRFFELLEDVKTE